MNRSCRLPLLLFVAASVLSTSRAEAHEGWGIVVDARGRIYFGDIPANVIWRIPRGGKPERVALGKHSHALVLDSVGNVYGTNPHLTLPIRSMWRLTPDGHLADVISPTENFPLGLQSFLMDDAGNMYSANARSARTPELLLLQRRPDGEITTLAGSTVGHGDGTGSQAKFLGIDGMAWGPDGGLFVADGPYVRRVARNGTVTTLGTGPLTEPKWDEDLLGIAVDANGNVYAADHANRRILRITPAGAVTTVLRTGSLWAPTGIAVAPDGLYVLEHLRMPLAILGDLAVGPYVRVRTVSGDGEVTELARIWGRRSVAAAAVIVAVVGVIVCARRFRRRKVPAIRASLRLLFAMFLIVAPPSAALAHPGSAIGLGRDGRIYFVDTGRGVFVIGRDGRLNRHAGPAFHWFAIDRTSLFTRTTWPAIPGAEIKSVGLNPTVVLSSDFPVAIARDGGLYYPEPGPRARWRIIRVTPSGSRSVHATLPAEPRADGTPNSINGLATGADGSLYYTHDRSVRRISERGTVSVVAANVTVPACVTIPGIGPENQPYLRGLDVAPDGTVFVAAAGCGAVLKIATTGRVTPILRTASPHSPTAVAVSSGEVYVLEYLHTPSDNRREWLPRVRKVTRTGTVVTLVDGKHPRDE